MVLGGSSMEYNQEAGPTKYLVGTEQGIVLQVTQIFFSTPVDWQQDRRTRVGGYYVGVRQGKQNAVDFPG